MQTVGGSLPLLLGPRATRYPSKRPFASRCLGAWAQTGLTGDGARSRSQCPVLPTGLTGGARPRRQHPMSPTRAHLPPQLHLQPPARRVLPRAPPCVQLPRGGCSGTGVSVAVSLQPRCPGGVQGSPPQTSLRPPFSWVVWFLAALHSLQWLRAECRRQRIWKRYGVPKSSPQHCAVPAWPTMPVTWGQPEQSQLLPPNPIQLWGTAPGAVYWCGDEGHPAVLFPGHCTRPVIIFPL